MFFQRKPGKKVPRVCIYHFKDGKQIPLPRRITKHLDGKPDDMIVEWMDWYAAVNSIEMRSVRRDLGADTEKLIKRFENFLVSRKLNDNTIRIYIDSIRLALPLFLEHDKDHWYQVSGKLEEHLRDAGLNPKRHNRVNQSFRTFYKWLQQVHEIKHRHGLLLVNRVSDEEKTPLKFTLTPEQVLDWAKKCPDPGLQFIALTGFFFSLRTSEIFGARRQDFVAGKGAELFEDYKVLSKTKRVRGRMTYRALSRPIRPLAMRKPNRVSIAARLVINIQNCRRPNGEEYKPTRLKRGGVVVCAHVEAAKEIIKLVNAVEGEWVISKYLPERWSKAWRAEGIPGVTIKDLRRASLYWLGHYTDVPFVGLKNHARHTDPETTALYTRRPEEMFDSDDLLVLDLDA